MLWRIASSWAWLIRPFLASSVSGPPGASCMKMNERIETPSSSGNRPQQAADDKRVHGSAHDAGPAESAGPADQTGYCSVRYHSCAFHRSRLKGLGQNPPMFGVTAEKSLLHQRKTTGVSSQIRC